MDRIKDLQTRRLMEILRRFGRADWRNFETGGLKPSEIRILFAVQSGCSEQPEGVTVSEISSYLQISSPTVTPLIKSLEAQGLVHRYNDQEDRRVVRVRLTEEGSRFTKKARKSRLRRFQELKDFLGEERSQEFIDTLEMVYQFMERKHVKPEKE